MAYYIFTQGKRPHSGWELLETIAYPDVAKRVYRDYRQLVSGQRAPKIAMVEARSAREGKVRLEG